MWKHRWKSCETTFAWWWDEMPNSCHRTHRGENDSILQCKCTNSMQGLALPAKAPFASQYESWNQLFGFSWCFVALANWQLCVLEVHCFSLLEVLCSYPTQLSMVPFAQRCKHTGPFTAAERVCFKKGAMATDAFACGKQLGVRGSQVVRTWPQQIVLYSNLWWAISKYMLSEIWSRRFCMIGLRCVQATTRGNAPKRKKKKDL